MKTLEDRSGMVLEVPICRVYVFIPFTIVQGIISPSKVCQLVSLPMNESLAERANEVSIIYLP